MKEIGVISELPDENDEPGTTPSPRSEEQLALDATLVDDSGANALGAPQAALLATTTMMRDGSDLALAGPVSHQKVAAFSQGYVLAGRYRIGGRIGKGGFGFVYSAEDRELDVTVAIKVLRPEVDGNHEMVRRFKQEIQLARQVTHENVCRIYDVGFYEFGDLRVPFLSMELLDGESLSERHKRVGPLPWRELRLITLQVALGLQAAHRVGIVHADLKPANIMLVGQGMETRAVITDFGLASAHATDVATSSTAIVGTPAYMSPEQVRGDALTPAADFYALGCTLYHVISGELPFVADSLLSTARARLKEPAPKLRAVDGASPANWTALVRDLLIRDPGRRISDAAEVRRRLRPSPLRGTVLAGVALLACVALLGVVLWQHDSEPAREKFALTLPPAGPALDRYEEGVRQWNDYDSVGAVATWRAAIDDGLGYPPTHRRVCLGLMFFYKLDEARECWKKAFEVAAELPEDERDYYEAQFRRSTGEYVQSARILLGLLDRYPGDHDFVLLLASLQRSQGEFDEALRTLDTADDVSEWERVASSAVRMSILTEQKRYREAVETGRAPLQDARRLGFARQELSLLESMAQSHRNLGQLEESRVYGERSIELAQKIGSARDEANAVSLLVAIAMKEDRYADAEKLVDRRSAFLKRVGSETAADQMNITRAEIFLVTGRPQQADRILTEEALPRLRARDNTYWEGYALIARAEGRRSLERGAEAIEDCYAGEAIFRALRSERLQAYAKMVCGHALIDVGRLDDAEKAFAEAYETRKALNLDLLLLQNEMSLAELALARGDARAALERASKVATRYSAKGLEADERVARELMGRAALALGDDELARRALAPLQGLFRGEHAELNLQIDLLNARLALRSTPSKANADALEALLDSAERLGYLRVASTTRKAVALDAER